MAAVRWEIFQRVVTHYGNSPAVPNGSNILNESFKGLSPFPSAGGGVHIHFLSNEWLLFSHMKPGPLASHLQASPHFSLLLGVVAQSVAFL